MKKIIAIFSILILSGCMSIVGVVPDGYAPIEKESLIYSDYNEFNNFTVFSHKNLFGRNISIHQIYFDANNEPIYKIAFYYTGDDWIFYDNAILINNNGDKVVIKIDRLNKQTEVLSAGSVWESSETAISLMQTAELMKLLNSKSVKFRLAGNNYYKDYQLDQKTISGLFDMLLFQK